MYRRSSSYKQGLDNLFLKIAAFDSDPELQSHWARYLCVMVAGFVELSVQEIFSKYAEKRASPEVLRFVKDKLDWSTNLNMERILQLAGSFDPDLRRGIESRVTDNSQLKDSIDSIYGNRIQIAHGKDTAITYSRIKQYYEDAQKIMKVISKECE